MNLVSPLGPSVSVLLWLIESARYGTEGSDLSKKGSNFRFQAAYKLWSGCSSREALESQFRLPETRFTDIEYYVGEDYGSYNKIKQSASRTKAEAWEISTYSYVSV